MTIFLIMVAQILGIIMGLYFKNMALIFLISIIFFIISNITNKLLSINLLSKKKIVIFVITFIISAINIVSLEKSYNSIYKKNEQQIDLKVKVIDIIKEEKSKKDFQVKVLAANDNDFKNKKFEISLKNKNKNINEIQIGDIVYFKGIYIKPKSQRNYKGFDYSLYLKTKNIYGQIQLDKVNKIEKNIDFDLILFINKVRRNIINNIEKTLDKDEAGVLSGILIGYKKNIQEEIIEDFKNSNLSHIISISGAHTSYIILVITLALNKISVHKKTKQFILILFILVFMILTGAGPSILRASIMAIYVVLGSIFHRRTNSLVSICVSMFLILLFNPYAFFDIGFRLSFGGTIGIVLLNKRINDKLVKKIRQKNKLILFLINSFTLCLSANLIIFPIIAYHYNTFSLTFFITNILASPLLGIIIICGFIIVFISFISIKFVSFLGIILSLPLKLLILIANLGGKIPVSKIYLKTPSILIIIIYYLYLILMLKSRTKRKQLFNKKTFVFLMLIIIVFSFIKLIPGSLKIYFIDVGQGDSCLIVTPLNKSILIDGGGSDNYDVGKNTALPYLLDRGITKLDYIFISHFDTDHVGGLITIIEELKVKQVVISKQEEYSNNYEKFKSLVKQKHIKVKVVEKGDIIPIEKNLYFEILWPNNENFILENSLNNNSIVCRLHYKDFSMLFTGDIEKEAEKEILNIYKNNLQVLNSTVLKVGHHGSNTSTTKEFLESINPQFALIGVAENNKFNHPNINVIKRLEDMDVKIYRTDKMGEITIIVDRKGRIKIKRFIE